MFSSSWGTNGVARLQPGDLSDSVKWKIQRLHLLLLVFPLVLLPTPCVACRGWAKYLSSSHTGGTSRKLAEGMENRSGEAATALSPNKQGQFRAKSYPPTFPAPMQPRQWGAFAAAGYVEGSVMEASSPRVVASALES